MCPSFLFRFGYMKTLITFATILLCTFQSFGQRVLYDYGVTFDGVSSPIGITTTLPFDELNSYVINYYHVSNEIEAFNASEQIYTGGSFSILLGDSLTTSGDLLKGSTNGFNFGLSHTFKSDGISAATPYLSIGPEWTGMFREYKNGGEEFVIQEGMSYGFNVRLGLIIDIWRASVSLNTYYSSSRSIQAASIGLGFNL